MSAWCTFRKGSRSGGIALQECFSLNLMNSKTIQRNGWESIEKVLSADIDQLLAGLDDAINNRMEDIYFDAAYHLCLQFESFPKFPLVLLESLIDNRDVWIRGICERLANLTTKHVVCFDPIINQSWKEIVDEIRQAGEDDLIILLLNEQVVQNVDVNLLFHMLKFFRQRVSVVAQLIDINWFSQKCSLRTLKQLEVLHVRAPSSQNLFETIVSQLTVNNKYVLQFSPSVLNKLRYRFLVVDGSIATAKNILKFATMEHTFANALWCYQSQDEFVLWINSYWQLVNYVSEQNGFSVVEMHLAIQKTFQLNQQAVNDVRRRLRTWVRNLVLPKAADLAGLIINLCERLNESNVDSLQLLQSCSQLRKYYLRYERRLTVSVEASTVKMLCEQIEVVIFQILRPFTEFPHSKDVVVNTTSYEHLFADSQINMEKSLLQQNNSVSQCYRSLRESAKWRRISIKEWAKLFYQKMDGTDSSSNRLAFFESAYILEQCGIVGYSSSTPKGFVDILYQSRI